MPWSIGHGIDGWCVIKESDGSKVACHDSREEAIEQLRALYASEPVLAALDFPEQRIVASAALRTRNLLARGGTEATLAGASRLMDPRPLAERELVVLDRLARDQRDQSIARDLVGRRWPILAAPAVVRDRQRDLGKKLAKIDQRLADRLYAGAVTTMRDALRRAGVKARVRARKRGNEAKEALESDGMTEAVLAAISVRADELLDRAFEGYGYDVEEWIAKANTQRRRAIAASWDLDPDELDDPDETNRGREAAAILVALLLGRARGALSSTSPARDPVVALPFSVVRTAMRVRDGATVVPGPKGLQTLPSVKDPVATLVRQAAERATPLPDLEALARGDAIPADLEGVVPTLVRHYTWMHGFYGDPDSVFEPHFRLDGEEYTDETRAFVLAKDPGEYPEGTYIWTVDDHPGCCCAELVEWLPV